MKVYRERSVIHSRPSLIIHWQPIHIAQSCITYNIDTDKASQCYNIIRKDIETILCL